MLEWIKNNKTVVAGLVTASLGVLAALTNFLEALSAILMVLGGGAVSYLGTQIPGSDQPK